MAVCPEYEARFKELPPSQRREALKRLTGRRRNPLTEEQCREVCPDVEQTLDAVHKAYLNKKQRSKQASAVKRMVQKANPDNVEAETAAEVEPEVDAVADAIAVAALSVEPAEIVAESAPEPSPVPRSKPIPIPAPAKPVAVARAPATPASMPALALPATPAKKKGLAGRFA